jgi:hypothetical protein
LGAEGIDLIATSTVAASIIRTIISTMAMTPARGVDIDGRLRAEGIGIIMLGPGSTSVTPKTAMVAVTPPSQLEVTRRFE